MPCSDGGVPYERERDDKDAQKKRLKERLDEVTRYLCYMCGQATFKGFANEFPAEIEKWWNEHQDNDTKRVEKKIRSYIDFNYKGVTSMGEAVINSIANRFIREAEKVHPVSKFHKNWFFDIAKEVAMQVTKDNLENRTKEQKKADALNKLTAEEKKLLGLK